MGGRVVVERPVFPVFVPRAERAPIRPIPTKAELEKSVGSGAAGQCGDDLDRLEPSSNRSELAKWPIRMLLQAVTMEIYTSLCPDLPLGHPWQEIMSSLSSHYST